MINSLQTRDSGNVKLQMPGWSFVASGKNADFITNVVGISLLALTAVVIYRALR